MFAKALLLLLGIQERCTYTYGFTPSIATHSNTATFGPSSKDHGRRVNDLHQLFMAAEAREQLASNDDAQGKVIVGRSLFRFSHVETSIPSVQTPYTIEERQYFSVGAGNTVQPITDRTVVFRRREKDGDVQSQEPGADGIPRVFNRIGPALFTIPGLKDEGSVDGMIGSAWDSRYAMALYCMEHTDIIDGEGLELACGVGAGGILSIIGAGLATGAEIVSDGKDLVSPVPAALSRIIVSDSNQDNLEACMENLDMAANFPESKAVFATLDWNMGVPESLKEQFDFLLGCDCADSSSIEALAKFVAFTLKKENGKFLHVGPQDRESLYDLQLMLRMVHGMNAKMKEIIVERIDLEPFIMDTLEDVELQMRSEDDGSYVRYIDFHTSRYSALTVDHGEHSDEEEQRDTVIQGTEETEQEAANVGDDLRIEGGQEAARVQQELLNIWAEKERLSNAEEKVRIIITESKQRKLLTQKLAYDDKAAEIRKEKEEERLRIEAEEEVARIQKEAEEEAVRIQQEVEEETARIQKEEEERLRIDAEAEEEAARIQKEDEEERLRIDAEAEEEAARIQKEDEERLRIEAEEEATKIEKEDEECMRIEAEELLRIQKEAKEEVAMIQKEAAEEAARIQKEDEEERKAVRFEAKEKRRAIIAEANQRNLLLQKLAYDKAAAAETKIRKSDRMDGVKDVADVVHSADNKALAFLAKASQLSGMVAKKEARIKAEAEAKKKEQERIMAGIKDLPCDVPFPGASMMLINGRRCLLIPSKKKENRNEVQNSDNSPPPPIVILGGMAQYIESWQHHFNDLSRERDVLMYEYLGSGLGYEHDSENSASESEYYSDVSLARQTEDFEIIVDFLFQCKKVDVIGFSLGARIALATIASNPKLIRNAHLTGISAERDKTAKILLSSWENMLSGNGKDLEPFALSVLTTSFTKKFMVMNDEAKVMTWIDQVCANNNKVGLLRLLQQIKGVDPIGFAAQAKASETKIQLAVGDDDVISTPKQVDRLNQELGLGDSAKRYKGGHAIPNENPREWRKDVLAFLNKA